MRALRAIVPTLLCIVTLVSCKSSTDTDNNQPPNGNNSTMSGTVDGAQWTATTIVAVNVNGDIAITARDGQDREITITLENATQQTLYAIGPGEPHNAVYRVGSDAWVGHLGDATGQVTLSFVSATRATGIYTIVLSPQTTGATGPKTIVGNFDVYFMQQT